MSALVANLVKASKLIIITDTDGLYTADPRKNPDARKIESVEEITAELMELAGGTGSSVGTGGMRSKLEAAANRHAGRRADLHRNRPRAGRSAAGAFRQRQGHLLPHRKLSLPVKKQWLGFHSLPPAASRLMKERRGLC